MGVTERTDTCGASGRARTDLNGPAGSYRVMAVVVLALLAVSPSAVAAGDVCFFPDKPPTVTDYASSRCSTEITWPTSWTSVQVGTETAEAGYAAKDNLIGDASNPGMYVTKMYVPLRNDTYIFFRARVNYSGGVTPSTGAPFTTTPKGTVYWIMTTLNPHTTPTTHLRPHYSVAWDFQYDDLTAHGLEMAYADQTNYGDPPKWKDTGFIDVDNSNTGKCQDDIDGGIGASCVGDLTRKEGYVRTVDDVGSTFIEMAVACKYFVRVAGNSHMTAFGTAFNPCTGTFYSTAAIGSTMNDNNAWTGFESTIDLFGIPAWGNSTEITSASWGGSFNPTAVVASGLQSHSTRRGVEVTWKTASEVGTVGFNLYRKDPATGAPVQVNTSLVPAMHGSPNGGRYALLDPGASPGAASTYVLEEIEAQGTRREYGPFHAHPQRQDGGVPGPEEGQTWRRDARDDDPGTARMSASRRTAAARSLRTLAAAGPHTLATPRSSGAARVVVTQEGLQAVTSAGVAAGLGVDEATARSLIRGKRLRIAGPEGDVACQPSAVGDRMHFIGRPLDSTWSNTATYWLTRGECSAFGREAGLPPRGKAPMRATAYVDRGREEQNLIPAMTLFRDPGEDFWLWDFLVGGSATSGTKSYTVRTPDATGGAGELTVNLQGSSTTGTGRDHHVRVKLNGAVLGETSWAGATRVAANFSVPAGLYLISGENELVLEAMLDAGLPYSVLAMDSIEMSWERRGHATGDRLLVPRGVQGDVLVDGFTAGDIWVLDLSRAGRPVALSGVATGSRGGSYYARFSPPDGSGPLLVVRPAAAYAPVVVAVPARPALASLASKGADYLVVTSPELAPAADRLAAVRQSRGLRTAVVTTDRIFDQYTGGNLDPRAIRAFLSDVHRTWTLHPRFVVLAGTGTYDGRDLLGVGEDHVPPMLVGTPYGIASSDVALADVEGDDGVPEFAIGRIPAATEAELLAYVAKLETYETSGGAWTGRALFVSDNADTGGDFASDTTISVNRLGGRMSVVEANLSGDAAATRATVLRSLGEGVGLFHYFGHAGVDRLAHEALLTSADVDGLGNAGRTPIAMLMTCVAGSYGYPGYDSLGAKLTQSPTGGAIATLAPASLELEVDSSVISQEVLARFAGATRSSFGEAVRAALVASRDAGSPIYTRQTYNLFGDPAVGLRQ